MLSRIHPSHTVTAEWNARRKEVEKAGGTSEKSVVGMEGTSKDAVGIILERHVRGKLWRGLNVKQTKVSRINTLNTRGPLMFLRGSVAGVPGARPLLPFLTSRGFSPSPVNSKQEPASRFNYASGVGQPCRRWYSFRFSCSQVHQTPCCVTLCCFYIDADAWESCGLECFILSLTIWALVGIPWFGGGSWDVRWTLTVGLWFCCSAVLFVCRNLERL